ncbi:MAG: S41 family peptidase [Chloroflexi bacterium]|nr:S41 family peptidase [Chloroflexota bacterium]MCY3582853.1 S41 family peptidase [Chloroflexota bacterium]MCY3715530.1 S41 family peptidase [Chloroflexota bacterium]
MPYAARCLLSLLLAVWVLPALAADDGDDFPAADIQNDEGGPTVISGQLHYSNALFTSGVAEPLILLEDQAGFIDRDYDYVFPRESQALGHLTSDFFTSPVDYTLSLPLAPAGALRDVDNDDRADSGLMVFSIAFWANIFGDTLLEERDVYGGGWSTGYASVRASIEPDSRHEIIGGQFIIYAPEAGQGFPAGFGEDGLLFTADDPIVTVPAGYTTVTMDSQPFTFDRSARPVIDLLEPETAAIHDFSELSYSEAFAAMVDLFRREYAFTELYALDWQQLEAEYAPRFFAAETAEDPVDAYALALRDFIWQIPDGHVSMPLTLLSEYFHEDTAGGLGIALAQLDDGRTVVSYLLEGGPAHEAGMELGAEILTWDGGAAEEAMQREFVWAHTALSTEHSLRLQQLRYITRFPLGSEVDITFQNPENDAEQSVSLSVISERASFSHSSFLAGVDGDELPIEHRVLPSGYGYVAIYDFSDNERLIVQLWERMIETFLEEDVPGIIIDLRYNGGGSGYLADQLGAYFFQEEHILGYSSRYNESTGEFYLGPRSEDRFILPPEEQRYDGELAVIIAPGCYSACELFAYNLTTDERAAIVGHYPSGGLGGAVDDFLMPEDTTIRFTVTRALDADKNIHIEAQGVAPTVRVPVTMESLTSKGDFLLGAAEKHLTEVIQGELIDGGELSLGIGSSEITATGMVGPGQGVRYRITLPADRSVDITLRGEDATGDTVLSLYSRDGLRKLRENDDVDEDTISSALTDLEVGAQAAQFVIDVRVKDVAESTRFFLRVTDSIDEAGADAAADD